MKKLFGILAIAALIVSVQFSAQAGGNGSDAYKVRKAGTVKAVTTSTTSTATERAASQTNEIAKTLALTPAQTDAIAKINLETARTVDHLRSNVRDTNINAFKAQIKAAYKTRNSSIKAVLSPTQKANYTKIQRNLAEKRGGLAY